MKVLIQYQPPDVEKGLTTASDGLLRQVNEPDLDWESLLNQEEVVSIRAEVAEAQKDMNALYSKLNSISNETEMEILADVESLARARASTATGAMNALVEWMNMLEALHNWKRQAAHGYINTATFRRLFLAVRKSLSMATNDVYGSSINVQFDCAHVDKMNIFLSFDMLEDDHVHVFINSEELDDVKRAPLLVINKQTWDDAYYVEKACSGISQFWFGSSLDGLAKVQADAANLWTEISDISFAYQQTGTMKLTDIKSICEKYTSVPSSSAKMFMDELSDKMYSLSRRGFLSRISSWMNDAFVDVVALATGRYSFQSRPSFTFRLAEAVGVVANFLLAALSVAISAIFKGIGLIIVTVLRTAVEIFKRLTTLRFNQAATYTDDDNDHPTVTANLPIGNNTYSSLPTEVSKMVQNHGVAITTRAGLGVCSFASEFDSNGAISKFSTQFLPVCGYKQYDTNPDIRGLYRINRGQTRPDAVIQSSFTPRTGGNIVNVIKMNELSAYTDDVDYQRLMVYLALWDEIRAVTASFLNRYFLGAEAVIADDPNLGLDGAVPLGLYQENRGITYVFNNSKLVIEDLYGKISEYENRITLKVNGSNSLLNPAPLTSVTKNSLVVAFVLTSIADDLQFSGNGTDVMQTLMDGGYSVSWDVISNLYSIFTQWYDYVIASSEGNRLYLKQAMTRALSDITRFGYQYVQSGIGAFPAKISVPFITSSELWKGIITTAVLAAAAVTISVVVRRTMQRAALRWQVQTQKHLASARVAFEQEQSAEKLKEYRRANAWNNRALELCSFSGVDRLNGITTSTPTIGDNNESSGEGLSSGTGFTTLVSTTAGYIDSRYLDSNTTTPNEDLVMRVLSLINGSQLDDDYNVVIQPVD